MPMRARLEALIDEMLDGQIMLDEALDEFEKLYIQKALARHKEHLSRTAATLGIHRNTLSKRVASYRMQERAATPNNRRPRKTAPRRKR
ncbi:MAG: Bacterial regulatory protein Fis family [Acidobacteriota bacterium]|jgi:DNA-binding NtrC family response regulator|nr:Bacterial regulatory protein Fis family [Acidobacteriota bacterium]MDT7807611.1 Bacterial regulatory protein Fis family [Acidobacteriota bacterium]